MCNPLSNCMRDIIYTHIYPLLLLNTLERKNGNGHDTMVSGRLISSVKINTLPRADPVYSGTVPGSDNRK